MYRKESDNVQEMLWRVLDSSETLQEKKTRAFQTCLRNRVTVEMHVFTIFTRNY